jgi:hypothetical protein
VYAGYNAALMGDVIGASVGFTLFEQGKKLFQKVFHRAPDSVETGMVGMASSAVTLSVVLPFEVVQRRMQVSVTLSFKCKQCLATLFASLIRVLAKFFCIFCGFSASCFAQTFW